MLTFVRVTGMPMPQLMLQFGTFMFPFLIKQAGYEQVRAAVMAPRRRCDALLAGHGVYHMPASCNAVPAPCVCNAPGLCTVSRAISASQFLWKEKLQFSGTVAVSAATYCELLETPGNSSAKEPCAGCCNPLPHGAMCRCLTQLLQQVYVTLANIRSPLPEIQVTGISPDSFAIGLFALDMAHLERTGGILALMQGMLSWVSSNVFGFEITFAPVEVAPLSTGQLYQVGTSQCPAHMSGLAQPMPGSSPQLSSSPDALLALCLLPCRCSHVV